MKVYIRSQHSLLNCLVFSHRMPISCNYQKKWCGPGPSQAILSRLLGLKQKCKITPLALTVHLNHFNTIIIMRLSNIIFKSLGEKKGISFPLLNHWKLRESKCKEEKVISYETGKESDKESPLLPNTTHPPTPLFSFTTTNPHTATHLLRVSAASLCKSQEIKTWNITEKDN